MKKTKLNRLLKFGILLFGVSFLIVACQKDDETYELESITPKLNLSFTTLKTKEIETNTNLMRIINKAEKKVSDNKVNKTVYNADYDFTINTHYAKVITHSNGLKNYTFGVYRAEDNGLLENVLLEEQADSTFKVFLVQYTITKTEKNSLINREIVNLDDKITFTPLDDISDTIFSKVNSDAETCTVYSYDWYTGNTCNAGGNHTYQEGAACSEWGNPDLMATSGGWVLTSSEISCGDGGGSTNTSGNPNGSPSGSQSGGYGSGTNYVPPTTTPVLCPTCPLIGEDDQDPIHQKNCAELQALLDIHTDSVPPPYKTLKEAIADLKGDLGEDSEEGYTFRHNSNLGQLLAKVSSSSTGEGYCNYSASPNVYGGIHLHVDNTHSGLDSDYEPMFSHGDIKDLLEFTESYNNPNNPPNSSLFVHMLVSYQGTYAIKIKDLTKLQELNTIWNNTKKRRKFIRLLDKAYRRYTDNFANPNGTAKQYQIAFLRHINLKYDLGISLFKAKENTNGEPIGWKELTLVNGNTANPSIDKKPCN